jgi:hypothetical protein
MDCDIFNEYARWKTREQWPVAFNIQSGHNVPIYSAQSWNSLKILCVNDVYTELILCNLSIC